MCGLEGEEDGGEEVGDLHGWLEVECGVLKRKSVGEVLLGASEKRSSNIKKVKTWKISFSTLQMGGRKGSSYAVSGKEIVARLRSSDRNATTWLLQPCYNTDVQHGAIHDSIPLAR